MSAIRRFLRNPPEWFLNVASAFVVVLYVAAAFLIVWGLLTSVGA